MKKKLTVLAALIVAVAALGGLYAYGVKNNAQQSQQAEADSEQDISNEIGSNISTLSDVKSFDINNENGSISITKSGSSWRVEGFKKAIFSQDSLEKAAKTICNIYADKPVEENASDLEKYGLDSCAVVSAEDSKGNTQTLYIGNDTSDGIYTYVRLEGSNSVYMIPIATANQLRLSMDGIIDKSIDTITSSAVSYIHIVQAGKDEMLIEYDPDNAIVKNYSNENGLAALVMHKPIENMIVYPYNVETELLANSAAVRPNTLVDAEPEELSKYGLDEPALSVELKDTNDSELSFKIGSVVPDNSEYRYAMFDDKPSVFTVEVSTLSNFMTTSAADLIQPFLALHARSKVNSISLKLEDKEYKVELKSEGESTFVTDEDGTKRDKRNIYINDTLVSSDKVADFYESIVGLSLDELVKSENVSGEPVGYIKYKLRDADDDNLEFYEYDTNFYRVKKGSDTSMLVSKQSVNKLFSDLAAYCS